MTDEMERQAEAIFAHLDELGNGSMLEGVYAGIDDGYFVGSIADAAYRHEREVNAGRRIVVGVNAFTEGNDEDAGPILYIDQTTEDHQRKRLADVKRLRDDAAVRHALAAVERDAADPTINLMPTLIDAVQARCTEGEIVHALEAVFGTYVEPVVV
jgi:methylmalonyl-CoA mutase N-terminal domain/subunit